MREKMDPLISAFTIEFYDAVLALWKQCEGVGLSDADSRENVKSYLDRNPGMSFVAQSHGRFIGAVLAGHDGRRGYIHHLAVHPNCRRRGIGRQLVSKCLDALRDAGIHKCHLFIFNSNVDGIAFWKSVGWTLRADISVMSRDIERSPDPPR
jgi:putative acetyltransferase